MKAFPKVGLLVLVALLAAAAVATSAQAVSIDPADTAVSGLSGNSNLSYGVASVACDTATADGDTSSATPDRITNLALTFTDNCAVAGVGAATVDCSGDVTLIAESAVDDSGTVNLNSGFQCVVTTAVCTITVAGPQTTQSGNTTLDEANDNLNADVDVQASRTGSLLCGPTSGTATFSADYATSPSNLAINP
jgi:hypothetical protein